MDINEVRGYIKNKTEQFVRSGEVRRMVFNTFTGSGKTTTVLKALDDIFCRWIYVAPTHDIIEENIERSRFHIFDYVHIKGKQRCCLHPQYKRLTEYDINISSLCKDCQLKEQCGYDKNMTKAYNERPNLCVTHAHLNTFLDRFLTTPLDHGIIADEYDVIVVDENPIGSFIHEQRVKVRDLQIVRELYTQLQLDSVLINLLTILLDAPIRYDDIFKLDFSLLNENKIMHKYNKGIIELYQQQPDLYIPPNLLRSLFGIIGMMTRTNIKHLILYTKRDLILSYFTPNSLNLPVKIIGLDGTANQQVWETMMQSNVVIHSIDYQYRNIYQLNGGRYPASSWLKSDKTADRLAALIDLISNAKEKKVLVVSTTSVRKKIRQRVNNNRVLYGKFYNIRSRNDYYKECNTIIIAHEPNPPQYKINSLVVMSGWDESIWRMIFTREEIKQAVGRLRQNITIIDGIPRGKTDVYIIPSIGISNHGNYSTLFPEARVLSISNLIMMYNGYKKDFDNLQLYENLILTDCPTTKSESMRKYNMGRNMVSRYYTYLLKNQFIEEIKHGRYGITEKGKGKLTAETQEIRYGRKWFTPRVNS